MIFRQVYLETWFRDTRYNTHFFVYVAGNPGSFGGIAKVRRIIVRIRPSNGAFSSMSVVPSTVTAEEIRSWYAPTADIGSREAKAGAFWADNHLLDLFPDVIFRSTSASLVAFAYP